MDDQWYFAYGSNLATDQKENRTGPIRKARRVRLGGWRIAFNKRGSDGTGKANVVPDKTGAVWGVIYRCSPAALDEMDRHEGVSGGHYHRRHVRVQCESGNGVDAVTYVAGESFVDNGLVPSPDYLATVLRGARSHRLPEEYIHEIEKATKGEHQGSTE